MAITREEYLAKKQIMDILSKQGYPTYAHLLDLFDLNLTNDPNVVAYMIPNQGVIVLNRNLDIDQVSTFVRHEILHEYLAHQLRMMRHLNISDYNEFVAKDPNLHQLINIAGDYEISNRGYTDKDKDIARNIKLNGQTLQGLVTEDEHPDWVDMGIEEMFDNLNKEYQEQKEQLKPLLDLIQQLNKQTDDQIQKAEQMEREANDISDQLDNDSESNSGSSSDSNDNDSGKDNQQASGGDSNDSDSKDSDSKNNDQAGSSGKDSDKKDELSDKAKKISKAAKDAADEMKDKKDGEGDGKVFDSPEEQKKQIRISKRLERIEKAFNDLKDELTDEAQVNIAKEKAIKADRELKAYRADPMHKFEASLNDFIKRAVSVKRQPSWSRPNRRYQGTGIYAQGRTIQPNPIPKINVYFDQSGSWDEEDIQLGIKAINVLKQYIQQGKIKVNLYYFSDTVCSTAREARSQGGTNGQPILNHITATRPDNVIVLTDNDIDDCRTNVTVPGAVWFLWKDGKRSDNLIDHLHGEKKTEMFDLNF